jgi:lysine 2,3-aminomutase
MWSQELAQSYSSVAALSHAGLISPEDAQRLEVLGERFKVRITPYYASLMRPERDCPIRQQAIPHLSEEDPELPAWAQEWSRKIYSRPAPWSADAIGDVEKLAAPRLTHRYGNRAILHLSTLCAVYCRFCFRKEHLNERERLLYDGSLDPAFEYLAGHPEIRELILTGGDPLSLTEAALERVLERAAAIPSLKVLRFHSRMAVTLPSRLTPELAALLSRPHGERELSVHLVSHFNHPREWTREAREGLGRLRRAGIPLFYQSVLLAGINDSADTLAELFQGLYEDGITPMYLHHPDWTPGTFQFRPSIARGQSLARELRGRLPGAALPHYVLDIPQGGGKASLLDASVRKIDELVRGPIQGAVYELAAPLTRAGRGMPLYLDLYREPHN